MQAWPLHSSNRPVRISADSYRGSIGPILHVCAGANGSHISLAQDITLTAGTYELTADMANLTNDNPPVLTCTTAEGTEVTRLTASSTSLATCHGDKFTLDFPQTVTIRIALTQNGQSNTAMAIDNLRLTYYGTSDINEDAIVNQKIKELNAVLEEFVNDYNNSECQQNSGWNDLIDKVNEAELVKDNTSSTEADSTDCHRQSEASHVHGRHRHGKWRSHKAYQES